MQIPDRLKWYEAKFSADDMPDWNPALFLRAEQVRTRLLGPKIEALFHWIQVLSA